MTKIPSFDEYLSLPSAPETWLIEPIVPAGGSVLLYGDPKVGKSYAALQMTEAIASQTDWLGFPTRTHGPVVYFQLDTPRGLWQQRLVTLKADGFETKNLHFEDRETIGCYPFNILDPSHAATLAQRLRDINPVAVVIDTLRESCTGADENDSTDMQAVIANLEAAVRPAALILISHARKPSHEGGPDLISDNRGSGYVVGRMDTIIRFSKKSVYFTGRSLEEGSMRCHRTDTGLWVPETEEIDAVIDLLLLDPKLTTVKDRAKVLSERIGKSEEAARSLIRRHMAKNRPQK